MNFLKLFRRRPKIAAIMFHKGDPCEFCDSPMNDVDPGPCPGKLKEGKISPVSLKMLEMAINDLRERRKQGNPPSWRSIDQLQNVLMDVRSRTES